MKTKIFSLHRITSVVLMVFFLSFAIANANPESSNVTGKAKTTILSNYVISMDAMVVVINDKDTGTDFTGIFANLAGNKQVTNFVTKAGLRLEMVKSTNNSSVMAYDGVNAKQQVVNAKAKEDVQANVFKNHDYIDVNTQQAERALLLSFKNDWNQNVSSGNESQRSIELSSMATNSHLNYGILIAGGNNNNIVKTWNDYSSQHNCYLFI